MTAIEEIAAERLRQKQAEGWSLDHDDEHTDGSLAQVAACYALPVKATAPRMTFETPVRGDCDVAVEYLDIPVVWPRSWHPKWWKPKDRRRDLVRAGALIVAEIERIDRASALTPDQH